MYSLNASVVGAVLALCTDVVAKRLFDVTNIEYTDFIRTSEPRHTRAVHHLWVGSIAASCLI